MTFFSPILSDFPALRLAPRALEAGGESGFWAFLMRANEVDVEGLPKGRTSFARYCSEHASRHWIKLARNPGFSRHANRYCKRLWGGQRRRTARLLMSILLNL